MKKLYLAVLLFGLFRCMYAQNVGINNTNPQVSLDITGAVAHRSMVMNPYLNNINIPQNISYLIVNGEGATDVINLFDAETYVDGRRLVIFNNTNYSVTFGNFNINIGETKEFICRNPGGWQYIRGDDFVPVSGWALYGNSGTNPSYNFIGTDDEVGLKIKTNNYDRIEITSDGRTGINGPPDLNNKVQINNSDKFTTLTINNALPPIGESIETHAMVATHEGEQSGVRIAGKFVSNGGLIGIGQNIAINAQVIDTDATTAGIALLAESSGSNTIAGKFKANGSNALAAHFDQGHVLVDERLGINTLPGATTLLNVNNTHSITAAIFNTDYSSFANIKGLDIKVKNPGQGGATGVFIDANDSPSDFAIIAEGHSILNGRVTIGTPSPATGYQLSVDGKVIAEELRVQNSTAWPDYVFEPEYELMDIQQLSQFLKTNKHLPDVPSAAQVEKDGIMLGAMQNVLLKKIEELTLYIIEQEQRIGKLEEKLKLLEKR